MDSSANQHHHHQETLESMLVCTKSQQEKKARPPSEQAQKCPRCDSTNTKFCYYNNYSLSQPRYFCKSCRRYWTKGGTLRNVPVGGGCRKNKRSSSSSKRTQESQPSLISHNSNVTSLAPPLSYDSSDLTFAFARLQKQNSGQMGFDDDNEFSMMGNIGNIPSVNSSPSVMNHGLFDGLRNGFLENTSNGFQNYFYGNNNMNNGNWGYVENGGLGMQYEELSGGRTSSSTAVTAVKQELCNLRDSNGESRVLWGFPWQIHGDGNMAAATADLETSGRQNWNGFGSTWHGLINSPLM
ncbi:hypothetical protein Leryth_000342 [Lithospermum erythrorhizon]|nr:hypothetical protein Leryth_000342 [Lithospermum erythrorhizon]